MNILFIAVFDDEGLSTNNSQADSFEKNGHTVIRYSYRLAGDKLGTEERDRDIVDICKSEKPDLTIFAKTNTVDSNVFSECKKYSKVCYWFCDPLLTYNNKEFFDKTKECDFFFCDKENVLTKAKEFNENCYLVCEGYDSEVNFPIETDKDIDVSFIGNLYGEREGIINNLDEFVQIFSNAYGMEHSDIVSRSKINLNFCTEYGASDRVYKVLASNGFLISDDWIGRDKYFEDGEDIVIYTDVQDLNEKISYYLNNDNERNRISKNGFNKVSKLTRLEWSKNIIDIVGGLI